MDFQKLTRPELFAHMVEIHTALAEGAGVYSCDVPVGVSPIGAAFEISNLFPEVEEIDIDEEERVLVLTARASPTLQ